ncbi:MAG: SpoIIE family protein phosphatase [Gammaproteobacteria bacterium]|nr:SpoIIE family protein phosphatase [Gammaproteobacteria bacterium]
MSRTISIQRSLLGNMLLLIVLLSGAILLITGVLTPEPDLSRPRSEQQLWIILVTLIVIAIAILRAITLARHYSQPIETLLKQSDRISHGNLYQGAPIHSTISEVVRLGEAHERMRAGLQSLIKIERDLQLARQIQQNTIPSQLPHLTDFELAAWSEPAEETGGDTYDIIGYNRASPMAMPQLTSADAECAVLLLADATGHGIGPALSVTETRAMLRMAVRMGASLEEIACHMNAQLHADLHGGRYITAWLAEIEAGGHTLTSFSAGQAPIFYYDAQHALIQRREANTPPLGIVEQLASHTPSTVNMHDGDIVVVVSDGVLEALSPTGISAGIERIENIITRHHQTTATEILQALRDAICAHSAHATRKDDCTAIIIKRTATRS